LATSVLSCFQAPFMLEGHEVYISASLGLCSYPQDGQDVETLLKNSDLAMYSAKEQGRNAACFFTDELRAKINRRMKVEFALQKAIRDEELDVALQPIIDLKTKRYSGIEALVRCMTEDGPISPSEFIPVAEESGLIIKLGDWVLEKSCRLFKTLPNYQEGLKLSVNGDDTELIKSETVVWAAGVRGNGIVEESGFEAMRGRVKVDEYMHAPGYEDVFMVGDAALIINEEINRPYPPTAQIAIQQGYNIAHNLTVLVRGKGEMKKFAFDNKGSVCSLGHDDAMGVVMGKKLTGWKASFMKKVIDNRYLFLLG
ncbi:EAL domain-containing protein, partial [Bacillus sp. SS-TM]